MRRGFTLVELLVVVGILSIVISISIPLFTKYISKAYKGTVISDVRNTVNAVETFLGDFNKLPNDVSCPVSGFGPALCNLTDGVNTLKDAVVVSKDVRLDVVIVNCKNTKGYQVHGIHSRLSGWSFCFDACTGRYIDTDGSGCP